jgi:transcriptional regulator with XRE-family HTH domain
MLMNARSSGSPDQADDPTLVEIGQILRNARMTKRMRLKDVADQVGCSVSMLSKIENGRAAPSLRILHSVVRVLETSVAALFSSAPENDFVVYRDGERLTLTVDPTGRSGGVSLERLIPYSPDRVLEGNIHTIMPGADNGGPISHVGEEVGVVIEGIIELQVGGTTLALRRGDSFFFRSELPHSYRNVGNCPARIVWINTPPTF